MLRCEAPAATVICAILVAALATAATPGRLLRKRYTIARASLHRHVHLEVYTFGRKDQHACASPLEFHVFYAHQNPLTQPVDACVH